MEYGLLLATFGAVLGLGLEAGIAAGILASLVHFAYEYSRSSVTAFTVVPSRSGAGAALAGRGAAGHGAGGLLCCLAPWPLVGPARLAACCCSGVSPACLPAHLPAPCLPACSAHL